MLISVQETSSEIPSAGSRDDAMALPTCSWNELRPKTMLSLENIASCEPAVTGRQRKTENLTGWGWGLRKSSCSLCSQTLPHTPACYTLASLAFFFSHALNREAVNSLALSMLVVYSWLVFDVLWVRDDRSRKDNYSGTSQVKSSSFFKSTFHLSGF